jgi:hypothetical protein
MQLPQKDRPNINAEMMPFKKFVQSKEIIYNEDTIKVNGTFKEKKSGIIIRGDIFNAHKLAGKSIEEIYKVYLDWFNHTRTEHEEERVFVSVKREQEGGDSSQD